MSPEALTVINQQLDPGERLLWSGQPRGGIRLRAQDALLIPFSLLWGGFACVWEFMVLMAASKGRHSVAAGFSLVFPLFGLPFVLVGLYLIFGRFIVDAFQRKHTFYGVTNERVIIVSGLFTRQVKSLQLRALADITFTQRGDGSGTILFGPSMPFSGLVPPGGSWPGAGKYQPPSFDLIERAKEVYDTIRGAQRMLPGR